VQADELLEWQRICVGIVREKDSRSESPSLFWEGRSLSSGEGLGTSLDVHLHVIADPLERLGKRVVFAKRFGSPLSDLTAIPRMAFLLAEVVELT
jgi:hypothetical protein